MSAKQSSKHFFGRATQRDNSADSVSSIQDNSAIYLPSSTHINSIIKFEQGPFDHLIGPTPIDPSAQALNSPYKSSIQFPPNMNTSTSVPNLQSPYDMQGGATKNNS